MNDVLYLSEIKNSLNNKLLNQKRLKMFKSIMKFMEVRVDLDLQGWEEVDIFAKSILNKFSIMLIFHSLFSLILDLIQRNLF